MKICDFVVSVTRIGDVEPNSVGIVKEIHGASAKVFFIGRKVLATASLDVIEVIDVTKTDKPKKGSKPYPQKICNICHVLKGNSKFEKNQNDGKGRSTTRPSCIIV